MTWILRHSDGWTARRLIYLKSITMRYEYLWTKYYYKPQYDIVDFARANDLDYEPRQLIKIMRALYSKWIEENRPEYCD